MVDEESASVLKEEFRRAVAFRLREARRERALTQRGMAEIGRSTQQNISRYEKGFIPDSWFLLARLQAEQAIDLNWLLGARAPASEAAFRPAAPERRAILEPAPAAGETAAASAPRHAEAPAGGAARHGGSPRPRPSAGEADEDRAAPRRPRSEPAAARSSLAAAGVSGGPLDLAGAPSGREEPGL